MKVRTQVLKMVASLFAIILSFVYVAPYLIESENPILFLSSFVVGAGAVIAYVWFSATAARTYIYYERRRSGVCAIDESQLTLTVLRSGIVIFVTTVVIMVGLGYIPILEPKPF